jgi:hypothetical protein
MAISNAIEPVNEEVVCTKVSLTRRPKISTAACFSFDNTCWNVALDAMPCQEDDQVTTNDYILFQMPGLFPDTVSIGLYHQIHHIPADTSSNTMIRAVQEVYAGMQNMHEASSSSIK